MTNEFTPFLKLIDVSRLEYESTLEKVRDEVVSKFGAYIESLDTEDKTEDFHTYLDDAKRELDELENLEISAEYLSEFTDLLSELEASIERIDSEIDAEPENLETYDEFKRWQHGSAFFKRPV